MRKISMMSRRTAKGLLIALLIGGLLGGLVGCRKKTPDDLMQEAITAAQTGDILGAQMKCERVIEKWPDDPVALHARYVLAALYAQDGSVDRARDYWREIVDQVGVTEEVGQESYQSLIINIAQEEGFDVAIEEILATSSTLAAAPAFARGIHTVLLSDLYKEIGNYDAAREAMQRAIDTMEDPGEERTLVERLASIESDANKPLAAAAIWQSYLESHPESPEKAGLLARIASYYRVVAERAEDQDESMSKRNKADELLEQSILLFNEEIEDLNLQISKSPSNNGLELSLDAMLADPSLMQADPSGLLMPPSGGVEMLRGQREAARSQLVHILMWDGRFEAAEEVRRQHIEKADTDSDKISGILGLAVIVHSGDDSDRAIQILEQAIEEYEGAPEIPIIMTHIAEINYLTENYVVSKEVYSEIASRFSDTREGFRALEAIRMVQERIDTQDREAALAESDALTTISLDAMTDILPADDVE